MATVLDAQTRLASAFKSRAASLRFTLDHPANDSRRLRTLLRLARFWAESRVRPHSPKIIEEGGIRWAVRPGAYGATKLLYGFPPDYYEMRFWQTALRPGDVFVDVGANIGMYTLWAASQGARVRAFEPSSDSWASLIENVALNPWAVDLHKQALGARAESALITRGADTMNRLTAPDARAGGEEVVDMTTVDVALADVPIRGLKIDVEGYEFEVIQGAETHLEQASVDFIQFEWNHWGFERATGAAGNPHDILRHHGYRTFRLTGNGLAELRTSLPRAGSDVFAVSPRCDIPRQLRTGV